MLSYGKPITMDGYASELLDDNAEPNAAARSVAAKLTAEIEERLIEMTVNAADWYYALLACTLLLAHVLARVGKQYVQQRLHVKSCGQTRRTSGLSNGSHSTNGTS